MTDKPAYEDLQESVRFLEEELINCIREKDAPRDADGRYRYIFENANECIHIAQDERLVYINPKVSEITGLAIEEMKDKPFTDFIHPEDREMVLTRYRRRLAGELIPDSYEYRSIDKDNHIIWFNISTRKIEWNGRPATLNILTDITSRKQMEESLRERIKELNCLYSISDLINKTAQIEDIFQGSVDLMIKGLLYPEAACSRIKYEGKEFKTAGFMETDWKMAADLVIENKKVGQVEVFYLKGMPERDEGPFLREERALLNAIAEQLDNIAEHKRYEKEREKLITDLQQALSEVNKLSGMLPICSSCKKIRDDKGYWNQIETYISEHSEALFSHGLCPECIKKLYPDIDVNQTKKQD